MTTIVKIHVGGNYKATVTQNDGEPFEIIGSSEKTLYIPHPVDQKITIKEVQLTAEEIATRDAKG